MNRSLTADVHFTAQEMVDRHVSGIPLPTEGAAGEVLSPDAVPMKDDPMFFNRRRSAEDAAAVPKDMPKE